MSTRVKGRVWKFGDNISGDNGIIEFGMVRDYTKPYDEKALADTCFKRIRPEFRAEVKVGDIVVAGRNFAHHNHPQVGVAIKACGIRAIVVESTDTSFIRKSLNIGLPVLICPGVTAIVEDGGTLEVDFATGDVGAAGGTSLTTKPFSERMIAIWQAGGLVAFLQQTVGTTRVAAQ
jgi:3-isopropylmalate/(R)-2-methylmalate dehydratase small subunit